MTLKNQKEMYFVKDENAVFLYQRKPVYEYLVGILSLKTFELNPIHNVR